MGTTSSMLLKMTWRKPGRLKLNLWWPHDWRKISGWALEAWKVLGRLVFYVFFSNKHFILVDCLLDKNVYFLRTKHTIPYTVFLKRCQHVQILSALRHFFSFESEAQYIPIKLERHSGTKGIPLPFLPLWNGCIFFPRRHHSSIFYFHRKVFQPCNKQTLTSFMVYLQPTA